MQAEHTQNMTANELIARDIPALLATQTGKDAFYLLGEHHIKHLPVVQDGRLLGVISEEDIFNHKIYDPVGAYDFSMIRRFAVRENEHFFEVIRILADNRLTAIPVVDEQGNYLGLITQTELIRALAHTVSVAEEGAILLLDIPYRDYDLSTIARIIEEEDVKILGAFVSSSQDSAALELTLKLNRTDIGGVIAALERRGYAIRSTYSEREHTDALRARYDALMSYLNV